MLTTMEEHSRPYNISWNLYNSHLNSYRICNNLISNAENSERRISAGNSDP